MTDATKDSAFLVNHADLQPFKSSFLKQYYCLRLLLDDIEKRVKFRLKTYRRVRLLVHSRSGACVALKAVQAGEGGAREAALHRALRHPHVLRCLGERRHHSLHYLFLEYAQGGELFDRIEPDAGMRPRDARRYWRQLAAGLAYLHARGVAHRDIKPENLLLDHDDNLKISDFGMATLFR